MIRKIAVVLLLISVIVVSLSAQSRFALVIGNSNYADLGSLRNPVNDATDMAKDTCSPTVKSDERTLLIHRPNLYPFHPLIKTLSEVFTSPFQGLESYGCAITQGSALC